MTCAFAARAQAGRSCGDSEIGGGHSTLSTVNGRQLTTGVVCSRGIEGVGMLSSEPLSSLDRSTLRERARKALRMAITSGQYRPGDHLSEVELATHLGVSRGTVREAMRHLQQEGLLIIGRRGMLRVNSLGPQEVRELFRVRAALEKLAVTEIISSAGREAAVGILRRALSELAGAEMGFAERVEADLSFHLLLCRMAGNSMLVEAWRNLEGRIRVAIMNGGPDRAPRMMSQDRHAPIVDAIDGVDLPEALRVIEQHMTEAADHFADVHG
jgi:DNA-binding GntR family transcriptional regulator